MNKQILRLALPSIVANITIPLVGLVDMAIVGHLSDATAIGGIAIGTMLFDLLYWNFGFLRVGSSGQTAQSYGRDDDDSCAAYLRHYVGIALMASLVIWLIQWVFVTGVMMVVPCSDEVAQFAKSYFFIRIWAAPATLSLMALKGWFIGMQDTVSPMATDITVNLVNIAASYLLAVYTPLGVMGVAYGTLIAQYTGLLLCAVILLIKYRRFLRPATRAKVTTYRQNFDLFIRSLCFMVVYVGFTSLASRYGDDELAVASLLMKLMMFFSFFVDGFAYAGEALVGRFFGAQDRPRIRQVVRLLWYWSAGMGLLFTVFFVVGGDACMRLLTNDADVLRLSHTYNVWLILMPLASTPAFMWDGIYIGAMQSRAIRNAMIAAAVGFVGVYAALFRIWDINALYLAYLTHLVARSVYLTVKWNKVYDSASRTSPLASAQEREHH